MSMISSPMPNPEEPIENVKLSHILGGVAGLLSFKVLLAVMLVLMVGFIGWQERAFFQSLNFDRIILICIGGTMFAGAVGLIYAFRLYNSYISARIAWRRGNYSVALKKAESLSRRQPDNIQYKMLAAACHHQLASGRDRADLWHEISHAVLEIGYPVAGEEPREPIEPNTKTKDVVENLSSIGLEVFSRQCREEVAKDPKTEQVRQALQLAWEAHKHDPRDVVALCAMSFLHGLLGEYEASVNTAHNAFFLQPKNHHCCQALAAAQARLAAHFQKEGRTDEAVLAFRDALANDTSEVHAWHWLCFTLTNLGIPDDAIKLRQRGLKRNRPQKSLHDLFARQRADRYRNSEKLKQLHNVIRQMVAAHCNPLAGKPHYRIQTEMPISRETLHLFHAIVEDNPNDAIVWCGISIVTGMMGDRTASLAAAEKAKSLQPDDRCCREVLEAAKTRRT